MRQRLQKLVAKPLLALMLAATLLMAAAIPASATSPLRCGDRGGAKLCVKVFGTGRTVDHFFFTIENTGWSAGMSFYAEVTGPHKWHSGLHVTPSIPKGLLVVFHIDGGYLDPGEYCSAAWSVATYAGANSLQGFCFNVH